MTCLTNLETDDRILIQGLCDGDQRAFVTLYERYLAQVLAVARRLLRDSQAAEDVAQEVFAYVALVTDPWAAE